MAAALCLPDPAVRAAAYLPGVPEPDPPTGEVTHAPVAEEPLRGSGIQWRLGPIRQTGTLSLDLRSTRLDSGSRTRQALLYGDIDWSSYVWEPWFVQVRAGVGLVLARDSSQSDGGTDTNRGTATSGRFSLALFPASRFPFELRLESSDSRTRGDTLGSDTRMQRLSLSQSWRPAVGSDHLQVQFDRSRLLPQDGSTDTLTSLQWLATRQLRDQNMELSGQLSRNERSDTGQSSRVDSINARHSWQPSEDFRLETLATRNQLHLRQEGGAELGTEIRQIASFASWRPDRKHPLYREDSPLQVTASARLADSQLSSDGSGSRVRTAGATLGATQSLGPHWRVAGAASVNHVEAGNGAATDTAAVNASVNYTPLVLRLADWQYGPSVAASVALSDSSSSGARRAAAVQFTHSLSRGVAVGEGRSLSLALAQSAGVTTESPGDEVSRNLAHSASVFWQEYVDNASQTYAGLSVSDSRTWGREDGSFQLVNLQLTRRTQLSRSASWSANVTVQATRNAVTQADPASTGPQSPGGWQRYHTGSVSYENQRAFGVPRLRFTLLLSGSSAQLERRATGDVDAPRERISKSLEMRLDYAIGRLEARAGARHAEVDGRPVTAVYARVQRRF